MTTHPITNRYCHETDTCVCKTCYTHTVHDRLRPLRAAVETYVRLLKVTPHALP